MQAQQLQFMNMMLLSHGSLMPPVVTPTMTPMMGGTMNGENNCGSSVLPVMGQNIYTYDGSFRNNTDDGTEWCAIFSTNVRTQCSSFHDTDDSSE